MIQLFQNNLTFFCKITVNDLSKLVIIEFFVWIELQPLVRLNLNRDP